MQNKKSENSFRNSVLNEEDAFVEAISKNRQYAHDDKLNAIKNDILTVSFLNVLLRFRFWNNS